MPKNAPLPGGAPAKPLTVLSMGWGVQTWTLAAMMARDACPRADYIIFADTGHEGQGTYDFARNWTPWLGEHGLEVVTVLGERTGVVVQGWSNSVLIPAFSASANGTYGQVRRQCTHDWKIMPIRRWLREELKRRGQESRPGSVELAIGISWDEFQRMRTSDVKYVTNVYPLIDRRMTRRDCIAWLDVHGLPVPPRSSCTFCPFKSLGSWRSLKRGGGDDWREALEVDAAIRTKRQHHGHLLYVHPARRPLPEAVRIPEDEGGYQIEMEIGCEGGYCMV